MTLAIFTCASAWLLHAGIDPVEEREAAFRPPVRHELLADVKSWRRSFDGRSVGAEDLVVVDPAALGNGADPSVQLAALKTKPDGTRRLVLATVAIARADATAPYWNPSWSTSSGPAQGSAPSDVAPARSAPAWLGPEDTTAPGTFAVRYWDPEWKAHLFGREDSAIERLLAMGFDGLVLSNVDGYRIWNQTEPDTAHRMIEVIGAAVAHAKVRNPDAIVALENADDLLDSRTIRSAIDLVIKEDLFYGGDGADRPRLTQDITERVSRLRKATAEGVPVFVVERLASEPARIAARQSIESNLFVPDVTAGPRSASR